MPGRKIFPLPILLVFLTAACASVFAPRITLEVLNRDDYFLTGDLEIKACIPDSRAPMQNVFSALAVNIYVTESESWRGHPANLRPYTDYINPTLVGIPGTLSEAVPANLWYPLGDGCYLAKVEDVFLETGDWSEAGLCPFNAIVVVAAYGRGNLNGDLIFECEL
jgi:hypothetical protein